MLQIENNIFLVSNGTARKTTKIDWIAAKRRAPNWIRFTWLLSQAIRTRNDTWLANELDEIQL